MKAARHTLGEQHIKKARPTTQTARLINRAEDRPESDNRPVRPVFLPA